MHRCIRTNWDFTGIFRDQVEEGYKISIHCLFETQARTGRMSQPSSRKKRRPPQRLSWPTTLSQSSVSSTAGASLDDANKKKKKIWWDQKLDASEKSTTGRKRARASDSRTQNDAVMWVEKFAPKSSTDLSVAPKKVKEIKSWLQNSLASDHNTPNLQKLLVLVGSPGIGKSTTIRVVAKELKRSILSWNESFLSRSAHDANSRGLFSVEQTSALNSFHEFLQQSGSGISSLDLQSSPENRGSTTNNAVILLEELPNLHGPSAQQRFRDIMMSHLQRSRVPTILIFSDVSEGKHRPEDLERLIPPEILYDNDQATLMQIHGVTKPKMKKILAAIAKEEKYRCSPDFFEEIHHQSNGDIRHAIMTLQLYATGGSRPPTLSIQGQNNRDTKLSTFHSLGKLLYAKRVVDENGESRLAFDPESILQRSDLGVEGSLRFLEFHSPDFFSDITDLSKAYASFSDVADMLGYDTFTGGSSRGTNGANSSVFPYECASSIAGRTVASTNIHPAPNKFRQFSRPKVFDVMRNGGQNQIIVDQLSRRLSAISCQSSSVSKFVTESLPFLRQITPQEVDPYLENLYSVAMQNHKEKSAHNKNKKDVQDEEELLFQKEQAALLEMDDIAEFDSD